MLVGRWVNCTAESVRLTCCLQAPLARYVSTRTSAGLISISISSSISGETNTDANDVCRRFARQAMKPRLSTQPTVGKFSSQGERRALGTSHLAGAELQSLRKQSHVSRPTADTYARACQSNLEPQCHPEPACTARKALAPSISPANMRRNSKSSSF